MLRRRSLVLLMTVVAVCATVATTYAISSIYKEKNAFQIAAEKHDTKAVESVEDFKYTHFDESEGKVILQGDEQPIAPKEDKMDSVEAGNISDDPKVNIYNKMLNTIDYFNNVTLEMDTSMLADEVTTVQYQIDIDSRLAYQAVAESGNTLTETYSEDENMIHVDDVERTYKQRYGQTYQRSDTPYIELQDRVTTEDDGIPYYRYRRNVTNCPLASYCVFPQELAYSYLKDFDKWDIVDDNMVFLGRECVKIMGTPSPYIAEKHGIDSFTMVVDSSTGILLDFQGTLGGSVSRFMTVKECLFEAKSVVKQFNLTEYEGYEEITGW